VNQLQLSEGIVIYALGLVVIASQPGRFWLGFALAGVPVVVVRTDRARHSGDDSPGRRAALRHRSQPGPSRCSYQHNNCAFAGKAAFEAVDTPARPSLALASAPLQALNSSAEISPRSSMFWAIAPRPKFTWLMA
jgi:hypothetical protein